MTWTADELVAFIARVLYEVTKNGLTLDYAFQKVKQRWRRLDSFKVFYDASFDAVRHYYLLRHLASALLGSTSAKAVARTWFVYRADKLLYNRDLVERYRRRVLKRARARPEEALASLETLRGDLPRYLSVKYSYHPAIVETLLANLPPEEVERILDAGNNTWIWLRVNTLKTDVDKALKMLEREAEVEPHPRIPFALLLKKAKRPVQYLTAVRTFAAVPQDLASIYAVLSLDPAPGEKILDLAAAPGMKTSLIVQLAEGRAKVVAADFSAKRVARMKHLLKALGAGDAVEVVRADSRRLKTRRFDKALLDAPCTSSGAFTKEPAVKIYPRVEEAPRYGTLQRELLANALSLAEKVVYAVCSIMPQEGEEVVASAPAKAEKPHPDLAPAYRGGPGGRTFPHIHKSEAFYIALVQKNL
ncbi:Fmu (Sun) domain protein [Pyrobaculum islandicum DSM 4184]|uniref:Fmu (Sun) domain protein n=1 Tax=Pyrobaculum islandicum (strain DSM 4184 / JCM 9189 / GEO3) TaxID=384616 RepID=A1RSK6_PYRIL|nr:RsmB/NOP family class I SAM-dependent RNA methyltransferase [Pyrobaculum islandicum]ABL87938.1 Fmu (Sun) domain protein [Pyrobaculum islandicum DSM 4184]